MGTYSIHSSSSLDKEFQRCITAERMDNILETSSSPCHNSSWLLLEIYSTFSVHAVAFHPCCIYLPHTEILIQSEFLSSFCLLSSANLWNLLCWVLRWTGLLFCRTFFLWWRWTRQIALEGLFILDLRNSRLFQFRCARCFLFFSTGMCFLVLLLAVGVHPCFVSFCADENGGLSLALFRWDQLAQRLPCTSLGKGQALLREQMTKKRVYSPLKPTD